MDNKSIFELDEDSELGRQRLSKSELMKNLTPADKEFIATIDDEYYKRVKTSDEFYRRKKLILMHLDRL